MASPGERSSSAGATAEGGKTHTADQDDCTIFDDSHLSLPELLGFSHEFQEAYAAVGGSVNTLAEKLLDSHSSEKSNFVAGRLAHTEEQKRFYIETLDAGPMVSRWIAKGYNIPFDTVPSGYLSAPNNKSSFDHIDFVRSEIANQVSMGLLSEVPWRPKVTNPLTATYSNKWRLVMDCRLLNPFVTKRKVKLEDLVVVPALVAEGDFMSTDDLEKGYWQFALDPVFHTYLGIEFEGKFYVANALILGITDTVFAFTKVLQPVIRYLRS